jgi:hypothetical protein
MLIYHPAYDAYHCIFRMLVIAESVQQTEVEKARLLDFYLLFPSAVASIRLPASQKAARKLAKAESNIYHDPVNLVTTFREMRYIQEASLKCIAASRLIDLELFEAGYVSRTNVPVPLEIQKKIEQFMSRRQPMADYILRELAEIPLRGLDGLKHRTELMEYKYDVA